MKNHFLPVVLAFVFAFSAFMPAQKRAQDNKKTQYIPYDSLITIKIVAIDKKKDLFYDHIRFWHAEKGNTATLLMKKNSAQQFKKGQKVNVKLCKVVQFTRVTARVDTTILSRSDNEITMTLTTRYDTTSYKPGKGMGMGLKIDDKLAVDMKNKAKERLFELCLPE